MLWIWNNTCKIYKTMCLNYLAMEDLCFMGNALTKWDNDLNTESHQSGLMMVNCFQILI